MAFQLLLTVSIVWSIGVDGSTDCNADVDRAGGCDGGGHGVQGLFAIGGGQRGPEAEINDTFVPTAKPCRSIDHSDMIGVGGMVLISVRGYFCEY